MALLAGVIRPTPCGASPAFPFNTGLSALIGYAGYGCLRGQFSPAPCGACVNRPLSTPNIGIGLFYFRIPHSEFRITLSIFLH
ncbi:MAG: hypothetical protein IJI14_01240 [Anaerolineaceae bacterium]|nr:hypothetical protein [Anaerolineaceae bacterium]